jgi:endogenous inhibitor of DNA gyrase (YacG/DUF329 family)
LGNWASERSSIPASEKPDQKKEDDEEE